MRRITRTENRAQRRHNTRPPRPWDLQLFADDPDPTGEPEDDKGSDGKDPEEEKPKTFTQDEVNQMIEKRLAREKAKLKAETEEAVKTAQAEAAKLAKMNADQKREYEAQKKDEQIAKQQEAQAKVCEKSNIVITTAKVFGRKAPVLIKKDVLDRMQPGTIVVDMAVSTGGNVEGSDPSKEVVTDNGVVILPGDELQRQVPWDASKMLSGNISAFLTHFYNKESKEFEVNLGDEIMKGCLLTKDGAIIHERFKEA